MRFSHWKRSLKALCLATVTTLTSAQASVYDNLEKMNIKLPPVATPVASYVMFSRVDKTVYLSGHIAKKNGNPWTGQLGKDMSVAEAQHAARSAAIDLLATLQTAAGGDLNRIKRIVKIVVMVNSTDRFTEHHLVANGASGMLVDIFGEKGRHARSAFGVAQLPLGACVEIELIAELE